jgi:hypothetical protein
MSNSPFSKPPLPAFGGILGKLEMLKTTKASIEAKKDFVESSKNAVEIKALQKVNEAKDRAAREVRERGKSAGDAANRRRQQASARVSALKTAAASKVASLTGTATAAVTSAKSIQSAVANNPTLNKLKQNQSKVQESISKVQKDIGSSQEKINSLEQSVPDTDAKQKLISQQVELRQLESKKQDIQAQIDGTVGKITG